MLPTDDASYLYIRDNKLQHCYDGGCKVANEEEKDWLCQNLYITVSQDVEKIEDGDWCIDLHLNEICQAKKGFKKTMFSKTCRKIIASTDSKLTIPYMTRGLDLEMRQTIVDNVPQVKQLPQIPQSFIKEYCDNDGKGEWEVMYYTNTNNKSQLYKYQNNTIIITPVKKKMYTLEEIWKCRTFFNKNDIGIGGYSEDYLKTKFEDWIKENL